MTERIQKTKVTPIKENHEAEQRQRQAAATVAGKAATAELDALLDEIDEVLEENAEEFVRNYSERRRMTYRRLPMTIG